MLAGNETVLPGIARILEHLFTTAAGHAFIEVDPTADALPLSSPAKISIAWLHRNGKFAGTTRLFQDAIRIVPFAGKPDECFRLRRVRPHSINRWQALSLDPTAAPG